MIAFGLTGLSLYLLWSNSRKKAVINELRSQLWEMQITNMLLSPDP